MEIAGKIAVVSGGGSGIGRAAVLALLERGARVVVADIDEDAGRQTVALAAKNAGIGGEDLFADDPGDWARVIAVDLTAVIDATRIAVREMKQAGQGGVIIN